MAALDNRRPDAGRPNFLAVGLGPGIALGAGIGIATGNLVLGIGIGVAIGAALNSCGGR